MLKNKISKKIKRQAAKYGVLIAGLIAGADATGQIIYTDVTPDFSGDLDSQYLLDINNDGTNELSFEGFTSYSYFKGLKITLNTSLNTIQSNGSYASAIQLGSSISSGQSFNSSSAINVNRGYTYYSSNFCYGGWCDETDKYVGIKFDIGDETHYGWARLDVNWDTDSWVVKDYAYESTPDTAILAGDDGAGVDTFPIGSCADFIGELDSNGEFSLNSTDIDNGSNDMEGAVILEINQDTFTCDNLGENEITLTVTDEIGQTDTCTATVTIVDNEAPVITGCPSTAIMQTVVEGETFPIPNYIADLGLTIDDNCTAVIAQQTPVQGTPVGPGTTTIEIRGIDNAGNEVFCNFDLIIDEVLDTEDVSLENSITFYPNPTNGQLVLVKNSVISLTSIEIIDINGRIIKQIDMTDTTTATQLSLESIASGIYYLKVNTQNASMTKKIIKQ